jgi:hypothetical protein
LKIRRGQLDARGSFLIGSIDRAAREILDMEKIISGGFGRSLFFFYAKGPRAEYDDDGAGQSQMTSPS